MILGVDFPRSRVVNWLIRGGQLPVILGGQLPAITGTEQAPVLLDRAELARKLGCSPSHVDTLRAEGMPTVWLGQSPRFELEPCLAWLRERKR